MRRFSPIWAGILAAVLVVVLAVVFAIYRGSRQPHGPFHEPKGTLPVAPGEQAKAGSLPANLQVQGLTIVQRDAQGRPLWSARSQGELRADEAKQQVTGDNVTWKLEQGKEQVTLTARRMEVGWERGDVRFSGGVIATTAGGQRVSMDRARFEPDTRKVIGDGAVRWQWGRFDVTAQSVVVDTANQKLRLRGQVRLAQQ